MIWGEADLFFRIWGAKANYFQGAEEFSFGDFGRAMHCFNGAREHRTPPPYGTSDVVVGEGELVFSEVIPLGFTNVS